MALLDDGRCAIDVVAGRNYPDWPPETATDQMVFDAARAVMYQCILGPQRPIGGTKTDLGT